MQTQLCGSLVADTFRRFEAVVDEDGALVNKNCEQEWKVNKLNNDAVDANIIGEWKDRAQRKNGIAYKIKRRHIGKHIFGFDERERVDGNKEMMFYSISINPASYPRKVHTFMSILDNLCKRVCQDRDQ
jgi:hypothetical protein